MQATATKPTIARKTARIAKPVTAQNLAEIPQPQKAAEKKSDSRFLAISLNTFVSAITSAAKSYQHALQLELATGLAMFAEAGDTSKDAKRQLNEVYAASGYDCKEITGADYKTVNRRINAAASLFEHLTKDKVLEWLAGATEMAAIQAIVKELEPYNLKGINSVLALVGKPVQRPAPKATSAPSQTDQATETPPSHAHEKGQNAVAAMVADQVSQAREARNRRQSDIAGALNFSADGVQVTVGPNATKSALIRVAMQLLEFAETVSVSEEESVAA